MTCACGNAARYIDETGAFTCAICPLKMTRDSIRMQDVPDLLRWCRQFLDINPVDDPQAKELRLIIGKKP